MKKYFLSLTVLTCFCLACENDMADVAALKQKLNVTVETVKEVEMLYSDSARVQVRVTGPTMLNNLDRNEPYQEFVDGTLIANYAIRYERKGQMIARDSVIWWSVDGQKLETEELIWSEKDQEIFTQKFARITTPTEMIYGHGFRADQDFSNARIKQVEGIVSIDDPEAL